MSQRSELEVFCLHDVIRDLENELGRVFEKDERRFWNRTVRSLPSFKDWVGRFEDLLSPEEH